MIMSDNEASVSQQTPSSQPVQPEHNTSAINQHVAQTSPRNVAPPSTTNIPVSYAGASQRTYPKEPLKPKQTNTDIQNNIWTLQTKQIVGYHTEGSRTLILMRGLPGSGKSYLAKQLLLTMCPESLFETHILSTDDFFYDSKGVYNHDRSRLSEAHYWNQNRAIQAMRQGISPIFIDNTNVEIWEMQPYVKEGINNGYIIEVLEPNTAWAKRANLLAEKNTHKVPIGVIRRKLDNFQNGVSGLYLIRAFRLSYSPENKPPVLRNFPPILPPNLPLNPPTKPPQQEHSVPPPTTQANIVSIPTISISIHSAVETNVGQTIDANSPGPSNPENRVFSPGSTNSMPVDSDDTENSTENPNSKHETAVEELVKRIEEIEHAWDNGESWDVDGEENARGGSRQQSPYVPQPPRSSKSAVHADKFLPSTVNYSDWSNISMFMPAWNDYQNANSQTSLAIRVETATKGTSVEFGDTDTNNKNLKILIGTPKDINFYYMGPNAEKIPEKRMLDKSSMTNDHDHIAAETPRCKNEEKHFAAFRKLFKNVSKVELRDIFDKCVGDVNWAVDIVLDGMANRQLQILDSDDISDPENFVDDQCECLAAYNIIPNKNKQTVANTSNPTPEPEPIAGPSTPRVKKEKVFLESSVQLKRQIEKNIVISDNHYSDHCLKIRKMRRGENYTRADSPEEESGESSSAVPNTANDTVTETASNADTDDEANVSDEEEERTVNVNLGSVFVSELDGMFGRDDMQYPENVETRVNMPVSLLNEINALWIESLMDQLDQQSRQSEIMLRQDEEFARKLAAKEEELARAGQEPAVPDLKEIMDMELALSIYQKQVTAEWRNNEPNDLAARMTRDKLYNLFPDVEPEVLSELLMAHDNNFQTTVEVLLSSTGKGHILEETNGVEKFIAKKELKRQENLLAEKKKALSEADWPLLPKGSNDDILVCVRRFRDKAGEHLSQRNKYYQKAQDFFNRDMTQVATYYTDVAGLHKREFDHANCMAAASLMQYHANKCKDKTVIDLHFLQVPEAKESIDIFIDSHIMKLRDSLGRRRPRYHTIFIITGRGVHSRDGPKVKPAVIRRLKERGISFIERNPGYLSAKVFAEFKMTFELS